jgi:hypothetical protein
MRNPLRTKNMSIPKKTDKDVVVQVWLIGRLL